jgi:hypothetical protein
VYHLLIQTDIPPAIIHPPDHRLAPRAFVHPHPASPPCPGLTFHLERGRLRPVKVGGGELQVCPTALLIHSHLAQGRSTLRPEGPQPRLAHVRHVKAPLARLVTRLSRFQKESIMNGSHLARSAFECGENHRFLESGLARTKAGDINPTGSHALGRICNLCA